MKSEAEVHGGKLARDIIDGKTAIQSTDLKLDPTDGNAKQLIARQSTVELTAGCISLQLESHPSEFLNIEILELAE